MEKAHDLRRDSLDLVRYLAFAQTKWGQPPVPSDPRFPALPFLIEPYVTDKAIDTVAWDRDELARDPTLRALALIDEDAARIREDEERQRVEKKEWTLSSLGAEDWRLSVDRFV